MAREKVEMTFDNYRKFLLKLQGYGYEFWTHNSFMELSRLAPEQTGKKVVLLRHDVDLDKEMRSIERIVSIEMELGISSTVFLRLHDPMYNVLGYKELSVIRHMGRSEHEVGLHCETADLAKALGDNEVNILRMDLEILLSVTRKPVLGVAAHGDISGADNHRLINSLKLSNYGLTYHAYRTDSGGPFSDWYISNYQGNNWKRYVDGVLQESGEFDFMQYAETLDQAGVQKCTFLIHPRPWHDVHYLGG